MIKQSRIDMKVGKRDIDIIQDNQGILDKDIIRFQNSAQDCDLRMKIKNSMQKGFLTTEVMQKQDIVEYSFSSAQNLMKVKPKEGPSFKQRVYQFIVMKEDSTASLVWYGLNILMCIATSYYFAAKAVVFYDEKPEADTNSING